MRNNFLLDADETILDFIRSSRESLHYAMGEMGLPCSEETFALYKSVNDGVWREYEQGKLTKPQLMRVRFVRFLNALGAEGDAERLNAIYFDKLSRTGYLLDGAADFLRELKKRGRVFLITNGTPAAQYGRLASCGLRDFFDGIFVSDEIGFAKPDRRFFEFVLQKEKLSREECIVIGDSLSSDIAGAANAGIVSVWYDPSGKAAEGVVPDHIARDYTQILKIVDSLCGSV